MLDFRAARVLFCVIAVIHLIACERATSSAARVRSSPFGVVVGKTWVSVRDECDLRTSCRTSVSSKRDDAFEELATAIAIQVPRLRERLRPSCEEIGTEWSVDAELAQLPDETARVATLTALAVSWPCPREQELQIAAFRRASAVTHGQLTVMILGTIQGPLRPDTRRAILRAFASAAPQVQEELIATLIRDEPSALAEVPWRGVRPYDGFYGAARANMMALDRRTSIISTLMDSRDASAWAAATALAVRLPEDHQLRSRFRSNALLLRSIASDASDERITSEVSSLLD